MKVVWQTVGRIFWHFLRNGIDWISQRPSFSHQLYAEWSEEVTKTAHRLSLCLGQHLTIFFNYFLASKQPKFFAGYSWDIFQWPKKISKFFVTWKGPKITPKDRRYLKAKVKVSNPMVLFGLHEWLRRKQTKLVTQFSKTLTHF